MIKLTWFTKTHAMILIGALLAGMSLGPLGQGIWAASQVASTAPRIVPEAWNQMGDQQKAFLVHRVQCHVLHTAVSRTWFLPQTSVDMSLILLWDCDPIQIWKMSQASTA